MATARALLRRAAALRGALCAQAREGDKDIANDFYARSIGPPKPPENNPQDKRPNNPLPQRNCKPGFHRLTSPYCLSRVAAQMHPRWRACMKESRRFCQSHLVLKSSIKKIITTLS